MAFAFAVAVPGRAIPQLLAEDPATAAYVAGLVALSVVVVFVSLKRGGRTGGASDGPKDQTLSHFLRV